MKILKMLQGLAPNDREKIIQAIYSYVDTGASPDLQGIELAFWEGLIKPYIDKQKAISEKRKVAGAKGAKSRWSGGGKPKKEKPPKAEKAPRETKRFQKPSLDELQEFCKANSLVVDCERFYNYYEANGWKVGRNPMKNWQATARNWARNNEKWDGTTIKPNETKDTSKYLELL